MLLNYSRKQLCVRAVLRAVFPKNKLSICAHRLLDERSYDYDKSATISYPYQEIYLKSKSQEAYSCRLLQFTVQRTVNCLDNLLQQYLFIHTSSVNISVMPAELHFVFMGDSRIRQQFFQFLMVSDETNYII